MTDRNFPTKPVNKETENTPFCNHIGCYNPRVKSIFTINRDGKLTLKGEWCSDHDRWWKRIELPTMPKDARNHLLATLTIGGMVTLAIKNFPIFVIIIVVLCVAFFAATIYNLLWDLFDDLF